VVKLLTQIVTPAAFASSFVLGDCTISASWVPSAPKDRRLPMLVISVLNEGLPTKGASGNDREWTEI